MINKLLVFIRKQWKSTRLYKKILISPLAFIIYLKNGAVSRFPFSVQEKDNIIYVANMKCGCTEIGSRFRGEVLKKMGFDNKKDKSFVFSFVRNPYSRVLSAYMDKVKERATSKKNYKWSGVMGNSDLRNITFKEFVELICEIPDNAIDPHLQSFSYVFDELGIEPDFIGRLETFEEDWKKLCKITGLSEYVGKHKNKGDYDRDLDKYYTPELYDMVYRRYIDDFEGFDYEN